MGTDDRLVWVGAAARDFIDKLASSSEGKFGYVVTLIDAGQAPIVISNLDREWAAKVMLAAAMATLDEELHNEGIAEAERALEARGNG